MFSAFYDINLEMEFQGSYSNSMFNVLVTAKLFSIMAVLFHILTTKKG